MERFDTTKFSNGREFESYVLKFIKPLIERAGGTIWQSETLDWWDRNGVDYIIEFPEKNLRFQVDVTLSVKKKIDDFKGIRETTGMLDLRTIQAWTRAGGDILNLCETSKVVWKHVLQRVGYRV